MYKAMQSHSYCRFQITRRKVDIFLSLTYLKKALTRLTRKICEFQDAQLWGMYHYIIAVLQR